MPDRAETEAQKLLVAKKCEKFLVWCKEVGIYSPKIEYPYFFEGGLIGARVKEPIAHREAFIFVPYKAIISLDKCFEHDVISQVYRENS